MSGILFEQVFPGATTSIVIGDLDQIPPAKLDAYHHLLWWSDAEGRSRSSHTHRIKSIQTEPIEADAPNSTLEQFLQRDARHLPSLYITRSVLTRHASVYQRLIDEVHAILENNHRARLTRQQDAFTWQKHLLTNAPAYVRSRVPGSWRGALRGLPAFIVGAGPSLDISGLKLAASAEHGVIFSADSALRALARHGVTADFVVSIDVAKFPEKCLPVNAPAPGRAILSSVSPPVWQNALPPAQVAFLSSNQLTEDWFATQGVPRTEIGTSENCGSTAIDLAQYLGCDPLYLFGLDLAVDANNQAQRHHQDADTTLYTQSNYNPAANLPRVPGNYARTVPTFALGDWRALDERLATRTAGQIVNVNDRGARLRGTTLINPAQFTIAALHRPKQELLTQLEVTAESNPTVAAKVLREIRSTADVGIRALPALHAAWEKGGPTALAEGMRQVIMTRDFGRVLGAFALKLMPHLVPPIEGSPILWKTLLNEFEELIKLASIIGLPQPTAEQIEQNNI